MRFVVFQINTEFLINQLQKYLYRKHLTLPLHSNKNFVLSIAQVFRNIHFLPHDNYFSQWIKCAWFQINTDLLTKDFISFLHFKKKLALFIGNVFRNIHFLPHFPLLLTVSEICNSFTKESLHLSFTSKKKKWFPLSQRFFKTSTFYQIFTVFNSNGWCNIWINT